MSAGMEPEGSIVTEKDGHFSSPDAPRGTGGPKSKYTVGLTRVSDTYIKVDIIKTEVGENVVLLWRQLTPSLLFIHYKGTDNDPLLEYKSIDYMRGVCTSANTHITI